jgi:hypothetical protein
MTISTINIGSYANDGTGDDLRSAFTKVNANFASISASIGITSATNLGSGTGIYKDINTTTLEFKTLTSTGNTVTLTSTANTVNLESNTRLSNDTSPSLGANLNLNGHNIVGTGDVQATVYGYDQRISENLLSLLLDTNNLTVDMGSIPSPTGFETNSKGYSWDFGSNFAITSNHINFGTITAKTLLQDGQDHQVTLSGNLATSGGYNLNLNLIGNSSVTLPASGTILSTTSPTVTSLKALSVAMAAALG